MGIKEACRHLFTVAGTSAGACAVDAGEAAAACEAAGLGPEDPLADTCAGILGSTVAGACVAAIKEGGSFTGGQCKQAAGCGSLLSSESSSADEAVVANPPA